MVDISWNESKLNKFYSKMNRLLNELPKTTKTGLEKASTNVRDIALDNRHGSKNKELIPFEIKLEKKLVYKSRIHTDKEKFDWASFEEYGTGRLAEREHIGKTRTFRQSGFYFWYAPADAVKKQYSDDDFFEYNGEMYPMNAYMDGKKYVMVFEQKPKPFMRPAGFQSRKDTPEIIKNEIKNGIGDVVK